MAWRSEAEPEGGIGKGELEFAAVFPKEERQVLPAQETEVGRKDFTHGGKRVLEPSVSGGEFLGPGVGRGEKKKASGANESRQDLPEKFFRVFHPIKQVGCEDQVKSSKFRQAHGVTGTKTDAIPDLSRRG